MAILNKSLHVWVQQDISADNSQSINPSFLGNLVQLGVAVLKRLWWHTHSYGTIAGIMGLALGSLFFLCINWFYRKLLPNLTHRVFDINQWEISRSK